MSLQALIQQIKYANQPGENTAKRVGSAFEQMDLTKRNISESLSKKETIDLLNSVKIQAITSSKFLGEITPSTVIPSGDVWGFAESGSYPNANGIVVPVNKSAILSRVAGVWSMTETNPNIVQNVINNIVNISQTIDPSQIVPSEALYNNPIESVATNVLKRIDESSKEDINYFESDVFFDGSPITDAKTQNNPYYRKIDNKFYASPALGIVEVTKFKRDSDISDAESFQRCIDFCEYSGVRQINIPNGTYRLHRSVHIKKGGINFVGQGTLLREESWWDYHKSQINVEFPGNDIVFPDYKDNLNLGCQIEIAKDVEGFVYDETVVDHVYIKGIGFYAKEGRTVGNTTAIRFKSLYGGPSWPFIITECSFRSFNKAINITSEKQYCVAFVSLTYNAFGHNDECLYFGDDPNPEFGNGRNTTWGLTFEHNKCHDNARIIRGCFAKDPVCIRYNNCEGAIAYADGTYPAYSFDLETMSCDVDFYGNHSEGPDVQVNVLKVNCLSLNDNKVTLKSNNFDGFNPNKKVYDIHGAHIINHDNQILYLGRAILTDYVGVKVKLSEMVDQMTSIYFIGNYDKSNQLGGDHIGQMYSVTTNYSNKVTIEGKEYLKLYNPTENIAASNGVGMDTDENFIIFTIKLLNFVANGVFIPYYNGVDNMVNYSIPVGTGYMCTIVKRGSIGIGGTPGIATNGREMNLLAENKIQYAVLKNDSEGFLPYY